MVDTSQQPALGYMQLVLLKDASTLLPIICALTTIHLDEWAAYRTVSNIPGVVAHNTVNHSLNFVDPATGTHTQHDWARVLPSNLDKFMWREHFGRIAQQAFGSLIADIAQQYPV